MDFSLGKAKNATLRNGLEQMDITQDFLFIRHGETDWNKEERVQGHTDVPLNEVGLAQAELARLHLKSVTIAYIVSSPLSRARVTAESIYQDHDIPFHLNDDLCEVNMGEAQGTIQPSWVSRWQDGSFQPDGAETYEEFKTRVMRGLKTALNIKAKAEQGLSLIVAHGGVFWAIADVLGVRGVDLDIPNATPVKFLRQGGKWHCQPISEWAEYNIGSGV